MQSSSSPEQQDPIKDQKEELKRYFSKMVDTYPDDFVRFITKREKAKRLRKEADALWKQAEEEMHNCLGFDLHEPLYDISGLPDNLSSIHTSAEKK